MQTWQGHGIQFEYPDDWEISVDSGDGETSVTVAGPGTAFWVVSLMSERPDPDEVVAAAIESFEDEYDHVDAYESQEQICLLPTAACDLDVVSLDLVVKASVRSCEAGDITIFVLYQFTQEVDDPDSLELLTAITDSLMCDTDDDDDDRDFGAAPFKELLPGE